MGRIDLSHWLTRAITALASKCVRMSAISFQLNIARRDKVLSLQRFYCARSALVVNLTRDEVWIASRQVNRRAKLVQLLTLLVSHEK